MAPRHIPWWRVDCDTYGSAKLTGLPSDQARWAWFKAGCLAKVQRQLGIFAGVAHLQELLGTYGSHVPDLVSAGLLHLWPVTRRACERCHEDYAADARRGDLVMHDYRRKQADPTAADRQARRRQSHGDDHGKRHAVSHGDGHATLTSDSRALSPSPSTPLESPGPDEPYTVGNGRIAEPYATLEDLTQYPVQRLSATWTARLDGLGDRRGVDAVIAAMRSVAPDIGTQPPSAEQLIMAVQKHLEPFERGGRQRRPRGHQPRQEDLDELTR